MVNTFHFSSLERKVPVMIKTDEETTTDKLCKHFDIFLTHMDNNTMFMKI